MRFVFILLFSMAAMAASAQAGAKDTVKVTHGTIVPTGNVYTIHDSKGKLVSTATAGQQVKIPGANAGSAAKQKLPTLDCVRITCPGTMRPGTVCWDCKAREGSAAIKQVN